MSKLSAGLKALINAPHASPHTVPAPKAIRSVYERLRKEASSREVGLDPWLTVSTAATMTMNSPDSLTELFHLATAQSKDRDRAVHVAEVMREVGLKCISFNGIPRTINCLGAFRASLPSEIATSLSTTPTREPTASNIEDVKRRGSDLWDSIYRPFESKLLAKLAESHPDLPVHIMNSHYAALLSDPAALGHTSGAKVGRVLTSLVAVSCLRAQSGVGPQVTSHVFGLRKAYEDGSERAQGELPVQGGGWLASDEGNVWILESVDAIVQAIGQGKGSSFAPAQSKL